MSSFRERRLRDLLADQALGLLSDEERRELRTLQAREPRDSTSFDVAAAALHQALLGGDLEPLPGSLRERLGRALSEN